LTRSVAWRSGTALAKGLTMVGFGIFLLIASLAHVLTGAAPEPSVMGLVGAVALLVNVVCAVLLFRFRAGDANLRAVWLCSRNDAIGNLAVLAAAAGVFLSGTSWPDLVVGLALAVLAIGAGLSVIRQARGELRAAAGTVLSE
jgi:Co/Zn/Cd efflux system component